MATSATVKTPSTKKSCLDKILSNASTRRFGFFKPVSYLVWKSRHDKTKTMLSTKEQKQGIELVYDLVKTHKDLHFTFWGFKETNGVETGVGPCDPRHDLSLLTFGQFLFLDAVDVK